MAILTLCVVCECRGGGGGAGGGGRSLPALAAHLGAGLAGTAGHGVARHGVARHWDLGGHGGFVKTGKVCRSALVTYPVVDSIQAINGQNADKIIGLTLFVCF